MKNELSQIFKTNILSQPTVQHKLIFTISLIAFFIVFHRLILFLLKKSEKDSMTRYKIRKFSAYTLSFITIITILFVWAASFSQLATIIGLLSAGLAIALKDIIVDSIGWLFIILRRPFFLGDRIEIGDAKGDVVDIRMFQFSLLEVGKWVEADQSTGRIIHVPNRLIFTHHLTNYNNGFGFIWNEIPVLITFESNWKKAKRILQEIANEHSFNFTEEAKEALKKKMARFMIYYRHLDPKVYTTVKDSGVLLTIRYLCRPKRRRISEEEIWEAILEAFSKEPDIELAYPTYRVYSDFLEGRDET